MYLLFVFWWGWGAHVHTMTRYPDLKSCEAAKQMVASITVNDNVKTFCTPVWVYRGGGY